MGWAVESGTPEQKPKLTKGDTFRVNLKKKKKEKKRKGREGRKGEKKKKEQREGMKKGSKNCLATGESLF